MTSSFALMIMFCGFSWAFLFVAVKSDESDNTLSPCEIEKLLKPILSPPEERTIQAQALRQKLINLIRRGLEEQSDNGIEEKRSLSSLAKWDDFPTKRNLQSLARSGYLRTLPEKDENNDSDFNYKRNIQYLAESGQLPDVQTEEEKRSISSLARNGELHNPRRDLEELLDELYEKRNIGSLARDFNFPGYGKRFVGALARNGDLSSGKRSIASIMRNGKRGLSSLARSNNMPEDLAEYKRSVASLARGGKVLGKRNVAAMLRQDNYLNEQHRHQPDDENQTTRPENEPERDNAQAKRNLGSVKAGFKPKRTVFNERIKRQADYYDYLNEEYPQPVYQGQSNVDYEDLFRALTGSYPEKRFLGSVARSGWPSSLVRYRGPEKRHIGSLARLGWLPSLRAVRRFNRSGRSTDGDCGVCRETSSDGQAQDYSYSESPEEDKRFLLIPAVDNILLRKFPIRPRTN